MGKRFFKITAEGDGGELVVGQVTQDFLNHWVGNEDILAAALLTEHLGESPVMTSNGNQIWFDVDNFEHLASASEDCILSVVEVDADGEEIGETKDIEEGSRVYCREGGAMYDEIPSDAEEGDFVPAMLCFKAEKGLFFTVTVETDGEDFDEEQVHPGVLESSHTLIEQIWYKQKLAVDYDYMHSSTSTKDFSVKLGYISTSWQAEESKEHWVDGSANVKESFEFIV